MDEDRLRFGPLCAAIGAAVLGVSVFLPWYSLSLTTAGVAYAQQGLNSVAQQFGNAAFQGLANTIGARFNALAGDQVASLSAHQLLKDISVVLLILAAIALVAALLRLAGPPESSQAGGGHIALVGIVAVLCVVFRMVELPIPQEDYFSMSLSWGIWVALGSSAAIVVGGLWSGGESHAVSAPQQRWDKLSGWTPDA